MNLIKYFTHEEDFMQIIIKLCGKKENFKLGDKASNQEEFIKVSNKIKIGQGFVSF